jgi:uncharacterized protein (DUF58 family)
MCCGVLCCIPFIGVVYFVFFLAKVQTISSKNKDIPSKLAQIWYRTILLTPRGVGILVLSIVAILLAAVSIDLSTLSTIGIFFLIIISVVWAMSILINLYLFAKSKSSIEGLISSKLQYHLVQAGDAIKQTLDFDLPRPLGYLIKFRVVLPERLGDELRSTGLEKGGKLELTPKYSRRGEFEIGPVIIEYSDLFGLTEILLMYDENEKLKVIPKVKAISKLEWAVPTKRIGDDYSVKMLVNSDELYDVRKYVRGDDVRHVHWKLTAKKQELMLRKPELTFVSIADLIIILDNQIPQGNQSRDFGQFEGVDDLLDRMVSTAASILDYAARYKTSTKVFYFTDRNKLRRIDPLQNRREEWLLELAKIKWIRSRSNSFKFKLSDDEVKSSGFYLLTSEFNTSRLASIKTSMDVRSGVKVVYFPLETYIKTDQKSYKTWGSRIKNLIVNSDEYVAQRDTSDKISRFLVRRSKKVEQKKSLDLTYLSQSAQNYIKSNFAGFKLIRNQDNHVNVLEGQI